MSVKASQGSFATGTAAVISQIGVLYWCSQSVLLLAAEDLRVSVFTREREIDEPAVLAVGSVETDDGLEGQPAFFCGVGKFGRSIQIPDDRIHRAIHSGR